MKLNKILTICLFLFMICFSTCLTTKAAGNLSFTKGDDIASSQIVEGVTWKKYKATSNMDDGTAGNQVVNVTTIAPGAVHLVCWTNLGESHVKMTNILDTIKNYEASHPNMMVVAAVNDDYFLINSTGDMVNPCAIEGAVIKTNTMASQYYGMGLQDEGGYKLTTRGGSLPVSENYYLTIYDSSKINVIKEVELDRVNEMPQDGETSFYFKAAEAPITNGVGFSVTPVNDVKIDTVKYFKGNVSDRVTSLGPSYGTIITTNEEIASLLDGKNQITVTKKPGGDFEGYTNVCGIASQFLLDGEVLSNEEIRDQSVDYIATRAPRTTIGFKADGTMVMMTIDGRQPQDDMYGVTLRENALALINEGCKQGFNIDGGGSTTMAVLLNGKMTVVNSPSDDTQHTGALRSDSDFILAVVPKTEMTLSHNETEQADGRITLSGSFDITCLNGFTYESTEVYVNGNATGQSADSFTINNLEKGHEYNLCVYMTYKVGQASYTRPFGGENIILDGQSTYQKSAPSNPKMTFEKTATGFVGKFSIDDESNAITKVNIKNGQANAVVYKVADGYEVRIFASLTKTYTFSVSYTYRLGLNEVYDVEVSEPYVYEFDKDAPQVTQYTYKFVVDGKVVKEQKADEGSDIIAPEDPTKEGYEFKGWDKEVGKLMEDITFTALFEEVKEPIEDDPEPEKKPSTGGMNCSFGAYFASSIIAAMSLTAILIKRKH